MLTVESYRFGGFELDLQRALLRNRDGEVLRLRPKSFDMLRYFAANPGRMIGKQELIDAVWPNVHVGEDSLFQCIRDIRAALGDEERQLIKSVSGRGYIFEAEVTPAEGESDASREEAGAAAISLDQASASQEAGREALQLTMDPDWTPAQRGGRRPRLLGPGWQFRLTAAGLALGAVVAAIVALLVIRPASIFARARPIVLVASIAAPGDDPQTMRMAADLTERLSDGLSKIGNIRVARPNSNAASASTQGIGSEEARFTVAGQVARHADSWDVQAHMEDARTGELLWAMSFTVVTKEGDLLREQYRLAGGIGYALALRINKILNDGVEARRDSSDQSDRDVALVIEQAMAFINHTTPERFRSAEAMLTQALEAHPDNIDLKVALASHLLRGVQSQWYPQPELSEKEARTRSILEAALRDKPSYLPALEGYCRFLTATNHFVESLVACARTLGFNPWNGTALFQLGLSQVELGRFEEGLGTFLQADRFDAPEISRWTWLLGASLAYLVMDRNEEALSFVQRSLAITPGTGRSYLLEAVAYQRIGRPEDAKRSFAKALQVNPKFTVKNFALPKERTDPAFQEAAAKIEKALTELGLPPG